MKLRLMTRINTVSFWNLLAQWTHVTSSRNVTSSEYTVSLWNLLGQWIRVTCSRNVTSSQSPSCEKITKRETGMR